MTSTKPVLSPSPNLGTPDGKQPTILLFGDSHTVAVHLAVERRLAKGRSAPLTVYRRYKTNGKVEIGNITFNAFLDRISKLGTNDVVVSMIGGSHYALFSTVQHPKPFDFYVPDQGSAPRPGVEIIPHRALKGFFARSLVEGVVLPNNYAIQGDGARLQAMRNATVARIVHLVAPPPIEDSQTIALRHETNFAEGIASQGVSPPELRRKFWILQTKILHKFCRKAGVEVMMPPAGSCKDGFLRTEYHQSGAHANRLYGELVLRSIESRFLLNHKPAG